MKYCINCRNSIKKVEKFDEIIISIKNIDYIDFIEKHKDKRIIIDADENTDLSILKALCVKYSNIVIRFDNYIKENLINILENDIPFFFNMYVNNWDTFLGLISIGVTDVYIIEDLGFEIDKISKIARNNNVYIRVFPNIAQSQWEGTFDFKKFFIRPEDVELYSNYVDVFEFFGDKEEIMYKIYEEDKKWFGLLNEIIVNLKSDIDNRYIIPRFAEKRVSCGKKCQKGGRCNMCNNILDLSKTLKENKLIVQIDKKGEDSNG